MSIRGNTWVTAVVSLSALVYLSLAAPPAAADRGWLRGYEDGTRPFREIEIGENLVVYYHPRTIGEVIVEKDFIVYQFDKHTGNLLSKKTHWRDDLENALPPDLIGRDQAMAQVAGEPKSAELYFISPESDVFPIDPTPEDPCWVVRSVENDHLIITVISAIDGGILGRGVPPPYTGFSMTGPQYPMPGTLDSCSGAWTHWQENAAAWFEVMGYSTEVITWPTRPQVQAQIQSETVAMFYELAHGGSYAFASGCMEGTLLEGTFDEDIEAWIADYAKMPFTFLGSCGGMCDTTDNTLSYEFRKGSSENTVTVGYCDMAEAQCGLCWAVSIEWQDALFRYMSFGWTVRDAFDQACADYPMCAEGNCMRFAGDSEFAVVPPIPRTGTMHVVDPFGTGDFPTIQAAVDSLADGDFIALTDGVFSGPGNRDIDCRGKSILIRSLSLDPDLCVIDCEGLSRGFAFASNDGSGSSLWGLTVTNGYAAGSHPDNRGGAIYCQGTSPVFVWCTFVGNEAAGDGGAVCCDSTGGIIRECTIADNYSAGSGGGIFVDGQGTLKILESTVCDNTAGVRGGGVATSGTAEMDLSRCTIAGNWTETGGADGRGGGIFLANTASFEECAITGNRSATAGGAVCLAQNTSGESYFLACTVAGNDAGTTGGGLHCEGSSEPFLERSILWGNEATASGPEIYAGPDAVVGFACSDVDSSGIEGAGFIDWLWYNTHFPPGFCDPRAAIEAPTSGGDYRLKDRSPCAEGRSPPGCNGIGALDAGCSCRIIVVSPDGSGDAPTIQDAVDSVGSYDIIELTKGTFTGPGNRDIDFQGKALVLTSQNRDATASVIDCESQGRAFLFHSGETCSTRVENITVKNGHADDGGAVWCEGAHPRLVACIFDDNVADGFGGAVYCHSAGPSIECCTLVENSATAGAGVHCEASLPVVANSIIAFGEIGEAISCDGASAPSLACCNIYDNTGGDWIGCIADQAGINGNFCDDPCFCDRAGDDYRLYSHSPCADAWGCGCVGALDVACYRHRVWNVPADVPGIAAGIDSAAAGDTVTIAAGTYYESGLVMKPEITLQSEAGTADGVIIDATGGGGRVMTCIGVDSTAVIRGITFTGGQAGGAWPDNSGGAVYCESASPIFEGCCFAANAAAYGGGVAVKSAAPQFRSCTFADNTASTHGGAVYSYFYGASVSLDHCIIARSSHGEAVYCHYGGAATLACCDVFDNAGGDWVGCIADQQDTNGNLSVDPVFCNPDSADYHVASGSPCASGNTPGGCEQMGALGIGCTFTSAAESRAILPKALALGTAVPNPFNPLTEITYAIPVSEEPSRVVLNIYDARGRRVTTLVDAFLCAGVYRVVWDARDHRGVGVASGVYFYRISWNGRNETARMVLLR